MRSHCTNQVYLSSLFWKGTPILCNSTTTFWDSPSCLKCILLWKFNFQKFIVSPHMIKVWAFVNSHVKSMEKGMKLKTCTANWTKYNKILFLRRGVHYGKMILAIGNTFSLTVKKILPENGVAKIWFFQSLVWPKSHSSGNWSGQI